MHTVWKGSISFGLVNIPVKMFTATEDKDVRFKYIHKECNTPVKYKKMCPACNKEVQPNDIVKGYEYEPGKFVILTEEDFASIDTKGEKTVEIMDFVRLEEIDPVYFDKTYYLAPQETGGKAYTLLREALNGKNRIAVAKITIRERESLAVIRVYNNVLVLETIFYPDEVKDFKEVPGIPENVQTTKAELDMASQLIDNLTDVFNPDKYVDTYREKLFEVITAKVEGKNIVEKKETSKDNIISLMEALQQSIQMSKGAKQDKGTDSGKVKKAVNSGAKSKRDKVSKASKADKTDETDKTGTSEADIEKPKAKTRKTKETVKT
ncbi:Ku protein [Ruminiclostridium herbifermentans]|uniref:Non-homologous end joining protein Ku n=1 Tax=Ruminiclostridium herbifermentans TaxID=2488810 RepID=A0A4U7JHN5_9FIRM|nr:Ku protein [Ruminiclostridium herbifermentans]QNU67567.1 Ku protein [Ruminiclostridium herbifermentans]